jgi:spore coat protein A
MKTNAQVLVEMYNFKGQAVSVLYNGLATGNRNYEVTFDRSGLPPGIYVCKLSTADGRSFERIVLAK